MQHSYFNFKQCDVTTIAGTKATVPAGRHLTADLNTSTGGVSIRPAGTSIDIGYEEWQRLIREGFVSE